MFLEILLRTNYKHFFMLFQLLSDPELPKKPATTFQCYCLDQNAEILRDDPDYLNKPGVLKKMSKLFNSLDEGQKAFYVEKAKDAQKEYHQKVEEFM